MILIQNIYYMLSYAFTILKKQDYADCATEEFDHTADLLAAILTKGIDIQIKRGLDHEYISHTATLNTIRGKIDISDTVKEQIRSRQQAVCTFDEFSLNSYTNQILKTTLMLLLRSPDVAHKRKKLIKRQLMYFQDVSLLTPNKISWNIRLSRNVATYEMLLNICYLVCEGLLQTERDGKIRLMRFVDEQRLFALYEKFVLEYYKKEYPLLHTKASLIRWDTDDDMTELLPTMRTDITITDGIRTLVIDTKYYSSNLVKYLDKESIRSSHLYQIYAYVKNLDSKNSGLVSGLLLYAKTTDDTQPNNTYSISGNTISVKTLDLNQDFNAIRQDLDEIVIATFGIENSALLS
ncbi:MAG TPA: 5-methylcytosine-specific restriction endonuclease system specificity protein McrC [Oscillospiraceae bacterium]|nr:5-methylcytosine-specific restriction endonuclease system specificity protein McrC [Oscillospiraceae bacterium]